MTDACIKHVARDSCKADSRDLDEVGAVSKDEIEVTPEMAEAGLLHLYRYHPETGVDDEDTVVAIYRAMQCRRGHVARR